MTNKAKKNQATSKRHDFESLCVALRRSWREGDLAQATSVLGELSQQYPELLVSQVAQKTEPPPNYYETLKLGAAASQQEIATHFFKQLRKVCRDKGISHRTRSYVNLLDAAFVLRKPRLRLSHDLAVVSNWLRTGAQSEGQLKNIKENKVLVTPPPEHSTKSAQPSQTKAKASSDERTRTPSEPSGLPADVPLTLKLLEQSGLVSKEELAAIGRQLKHSSSTDVDILVTKSGYISVGEMASLKLAEMLIGSGQVSMPQIIVALYDERNTGVRMAESLQTRGWLPVETPIPHIQH
jgi:hypothetical protein